MNENSSDQNWLEDFPPGPTLGWKICRAGSWWAIYRHAIVSLKPGI